MATTDVPPPPHQLTFDDVRTHPVFANATSLMSNLAEKMLVLQILTLATSLLYWENGLPIWSMIFFASETIVVAEGLYMLCMTSQASWASGQLNGAVQQRLAAMASQLEFCWRDGMGETTDGSTQLIRPGLCRISLNSKLRDRLASTQSWNYCWTLLILANTLVHELAHAAMMLRADYKVGNVHLMEGCETSEEGYELENALWGGILNEMRTVDTDGSPGVIPVMLQWPDARLTAKYDGVSGGQHILCRWAPVIHPWRSLKYEYLMAQIENRPYKKMRQPSSDDFGEFSGA